MTRSATSGPVDAPSRSRVVSHYIAAWSAGGGGTGLSTAVGLINFPFARGVDVIVGATVVPAALCAVLGLLAGLDATAPDRSHTAQAPVLRIFWWIATAAAVLTSVVVCWLLLWWTDDAALHGAYARSARVALATAVVMCAATVTARALRARLAVVAGCLLTVAALAGAGVFLLLGAGAPTAGAVQLKNLPAGIALLNPGALAQLAGCVVVAARRATR